MTIRLLATISYAEVVGKYICISAQQQNQTYGRPAVVERVADDMLYYHMFPWGEWDAAENEWQVRAPANASELGDMFKCEAHGAIPVCDTPEEALALYQESRRARRAIYQMRRDMLNSVRERALAGAFSNPAGEI